jgi:RimJ/RimL family protein N-acetyltransferase
MVTLRPATMDDAARLFSWRVDDETVRNSTGPAPASFDAHRKWLEQTLQNPRVALYVGYDPNNQVAVGTIRLDRLNDGESEVSITVDPELRGRGYGRQLIEQAAKAAGPVRLIAHVKESNPASLRTFTALGFRGGQRDGDLLRLVRE